MKTHKYQIVSLIAACFCAASATAFADQSGPRVFGKGSAFTIADLPAGNLKSGLQALEPQARERAMQWLHTLDFGESDAASHLRVDPDGGVYIVCPGLHDGCGCPSSKHESGEAASHDDNPPAAGTGNMVQEKAAVPVSTPPIYNSNPGAPYHVYLDFNGALVKGTAWNTESKVNTWFCLAWSVDEDRTTFNDDEQADMRRVWERIAEDYAPFNVNVTTDAAYDPDNYTGDKNKVGWLLFTPTSDRDGRQCPHSGSGGVAYVGVFGISDYATKYQPAWVTPTDSSYMAEAGSHEMGHNLGLSHDGTTTQAYYGGHPATPTAPSWGPIMGTGYNRNVSQWSKGEYLSSNQNQNDLTIISNRIPYREDDHGDTFANATVWINSTINQNGVVETTGNPDFFKFTTGAGSINFNAAGYRCDNETWGGNLDIKLELYDESQQLVFSHNPAADTDASITQTVLAGTYYLVIKPSAAGSPTTNPPSGYTAYGSLGQYKITGSTVPTDAIIINTPKGGEFWTGGTTQTVTWSSGMGGNVKIELLKNGSLDSTIVASTPNIGSYIWNIPPGQAAAADYRVRITSVETPEKSDTSFSDFTISPTPLPEITVQQPAGTDLADGLSMIDFGNTPLSSPASLAFTIRNSGTADLTDLAVSMSGIHASDFIMDPLAVDILAPGDEITFNVEFSPAELGARTATLQIASNDSDENPFDITLNGVGTAPEIVVEEPLGTDLTDSVDTVDFGSVTVTELVTKTFTIRNTGMEDLTGLSIGKSGSHPSDFVVGSLGATTLAPGGQTTFDVSFTPQASGVRGAILQIASNDSDENPFDITLAGIGVPQQIPEIVVEQPPGSGLIHGESEVGFGFTDLGVAITRSFTIRNEGIVDLTGLAITKSGSYPEDFTVAPLQSTTLAPGAEMDFTVTFLPAASGGRSASLHIASNDSDENPFDIALTGGGVVPLIPEIVVEQPLGTELTDGSSLVEYGNTNVGQSVIKTFNLRNTGSVDLTGLALSVVGTHASDFATSQLVVSSLEPGTAMTFTVTFTPAASGYREAAIRIASNDQDENPFEIALSGSGVIQSAPEIVVEQPFGTGLADGANTVVFGNIMVGQPIEKTFRLRNIGSADLTGLTVGKGGVHSADFAVGSLGTTSLAPGEETSFSVTFTPSLSGNRGAALYIVSNDPDENPFDIELSGVGAEPPAPEIVIEQPSGTVLSDGAETVIFDNVMIGQSGSKTFTLRNTGSADLNGLEVGKVGAHVSDFVISPLETTMLPPGAETTFTVTFTPTASGAREATLQVASNDQDENPFDISLNGLGVVPPAPEIEVEQPLGTLLTDGASTVKFGDVTIGKPVARIFKLRNTGSVDLTAISVTRDGLHAADFTVGNIGSGTLAPGGEITFTVTFVPAASGTRSAVLRIASNDPDQNPFDVSLSGVGNVAKAPKIVVRGKSGKVLKNGAVQNLGPVRVGTSDKAQVFSIENAGNRHLKNIRIRLDGNDARQFKLINPKKSRLAPGKKTTFRVIFSPSSSGQKMARLLISSNDPKRKLVPIKLKGRGIRSASAGQD